MVNWSSPDIVAWKKEARDIQQGLCEKLGDRVWDCFKKDERWALEKKVGFALFGEPSDLPSEKRSNGYDIEQETEIRRMCDWIYREVNSSEILVAFLFVIGKVHADKFCIPVIKVHAKGEAVFLDSLGRIYKDWSDFKSNNKLPKSLVCYPLNGLYQLDNNNNDVLLEFSPSPACALGPKVFNVFDKVTTGIGLGATVIGLAGLAVTVAPSLIIASTVGTAVSGVYALGRGSHHLHDRRTHNQTISPADCDARNCWISVLGGAFGMGSALAISKAAAMAAGGGLLGRTSSFFVNILNFGALTVNGLGIINGLAYLVEKKQRKELGPLDVFQWSASVLFFYNAAINIKTANGIVKDVQRKVIGDFTSGLRVGRKEHLAEMIEKNAAISKENCAKLIKGISFIQSNSEFFTWVKFSQQGTPETEGHMLFSIKAINHKLGGNFNHRSLQNFTCISKLFKETFQLMRTAHAENRKNTVVIDAFLKFEFKTNLLTRLSCLYFRYCDPEQEEGRKKKEIFNMVVQTEEFALDVGYSTEATLVSYFEFICIYKRSRLQKMIKAYDQEKSRLISLFGEKFDEGALNSEWVIQDSCRLEDAFNEQIDRDIMKSNANLKKEFIRYNAEVGILNESGNLKFCTNIEALIQFYRCFVIDLDERLTLQEYFDVIRNTVQDKNLRINSTEGEYCSRRIIYYDETVPVIVEVRETDDVVFFETTRFQDIDKYM